MYKAKHNDLISVGTYPASSVLYPGYDTVKEGAPHLLKEGPGQLIIIASGLHNSAEELEDFSYLAP